jgi:hypothetical protein
VPQTRKTARAHTPFNPLRIKSNIQESTLEVQLLSSRQRAGAGGATLYEYEYEIATTRGRKRIVNAVSITGAGRRCCAPGGGGVLAFFAAAFRRAF